MRISQSILGQADKCMLAAQYTIDKPAWAKKVGSAARAVGTGYHAGLEWFYRQRMESFDVAPDLEGMCREAWKVFEESTTFDRYDQTPLDEFKWDDKVPDVETGRAMIQSMLHQYVTGGHVWPNDWLVLGVEMPLPKDDPDLGPIRGSIDLVLQDPAGGIMLVDHKTGGKMWDQGKAEPRKQNQAPFYTRAAKRMFPDAPYVRFAFDIMTYPSARSGPKFERRTSNPDARHEEAILKKALDFTTMYQEVHVRLGRDLPANPASTLCNGKWCDFFDGCAFGAALEQPLAA